MIHVTALPLTFLLSMMILQSVNIYAVEPQSIRTLHQNKSDAIKQLQLLTNMITKMNGSSNSNIKKGSRQKLQNRHLQTVDNISISYDQCFSLTMESPGYGTMTFSFVTVKAVRDYDGNLDDAIDSRTKDITLHLRDYIFPAVEYYSNEQELMCEACKKKCSSNYYNVVGDDDGDDDGIHGEEVSSKYYNDVGDDDGTHGEEVEMQVQCDTCISECNKIENMEENYYVDATDFSQCMTIVEEDRSGGVTAIHAGPICASDGSKITIGVFADEDCLIPLPELSVEDFLYDYDGNNYKLSHALLKQTYSEGQYVDCFDDVNTEIFCEEVFENAELVDDYNKETREAW